MRVAVQPARGAQCVFRPHTARTSCIAQLVYARTSSDVGVVLLTGNGPSPKDGGWAFCAGGDQRIRGRSGYQYASGRDRRHRRRRPRTGDFTFSKVQRLIRFMPQSRYLPG